MPGARISLLEWFQRELRPGDFAAAFPPRRRRVFGSTEEFAAARRMERLQTAPARGRIARAKAKLRELAATGAVILWSRYPTDNAKLKPVEAGDTAWRRAHFAPRADVMRLPGDPPEQWPHNDVQVEERAAAASHAPARLRKVARDMILAELIDFQRSPPDGPADRETACWAVAAWPVASR